MTTEGKSYVKCVKFYMAEYSDIHSKVMIRSSKVDFDPKSISLHVPSQITRGRVDTLSSKIFIHKGCA